jgi:hypothetical protein
VLLLLLPFSLTGALSLSNIFKPQRGDNESLDYRNFSILKKPKRKMEILLIINVGGAGVRAVLSP